MSQESIGRRIVLSVNRRQLTIVTQTQTGAHRATFDCAADQDPFDDEDVRRAMEDTRITLMKPGQRNMTRCWTTPLGIIYTHLMLGPPMWWLPKVKLSRRGLMVGWLHVAAAVSFRGHSSRTT
jgi:hypothetical protein